MKKEALIYEIYLSVALKFAKQSKFKQAEKSLKIMRDILKDCEKRKEQK